MKLTIVNCGDPREYAVIKYQPLAPAYLAACTSPDWEIELVDENFEVFRPERCEADLVAFSAIPRHIDRAYVHARMLRERGITTVGGGMHVSAIPEEATQYFDAIVEGEAEPIWAEVLRDFEQGELEPHYISGFDQDLEGLTLPDRRYIHPGYRIASVSTSRGCPNSCSFCYEGSLRRKTYRVIPTETILEDFARVRQKVVVLSDANFLGFTEAHLDSRRELCEGLIRRRIAKYWGAQVTADVVRYPDLPELLYRAGCRLAFIGFETVGPKNLDSIGKGRNAELDYTEVVETMQRAGIAVAASFILGLDTHCPDYGEDLKRWLDQARPLFLNLGVLTPMPNTALYRQARREGRLLADGPALWRQLDKATNTLRYRHLTADEVEATFEDVMTHYFQPKVIAQNFLHHLLVDRQLVMSLLYLGAARRKSSSRSHSVAFAGPPKRLEASSPHEQAEATPPRPVELRLLTWNVNQWPLLSRINRCARDLERVRALLVDYDLVCLQECWSAESQELRWSFPFHYHDHQTTGWGLGSGLLILSKLPIHAWYSQRFDARAFPDSLAAKGATLVRVGVEGFGEVDLVNTHLQAWRGRDVLLAQMAELASFVDERARSSLGLVVGDLNSSPGAAEYDYLKAACSLRDLLEERPIEADRDGERPGRRARWPLPWPRRWSGNDRPHSGSSGRLDHIFLRRNNGATAQVRETAALPPPGSGERCPSDHRGLSLRLVIEAES